MFVELMGFLVLNYILNVLVYINIIEKYMCSFELFGLYFDMCLYLLVFVI